ncbi:FXYD domain containing ion transport regulator 7 isoform X1 [Denticeps clupeoides]|uniref:FXYD domain containing ion transport regulator 7 isoform X1 n=1 Tax=Denticeps clupeoides TaxID=299321 RepID=UPI0010A2B144|nr:uncharacterized protein LOC114790977 isoform X1 [Denticeps clupeoides]
MESTAEFDQSAFHYDYETLRTTGVILAVVMFVSGILIALSPVQWKGPRYQRQKFLLRPYEQDGSWWVSGTTPDMRENGLNVLEICYLESLTPTLASLSFLFQVSVRKYLSQSMFLKSLKTQKSLELVNSSNLEELWVYSCFIITMVV